MEKSSPEQTSNSNPKPLRSLEELAWLYAVSYDEKVYIPLFEEMRERFGIEAANGAWMDALDLRMIVAPGWGTLT